MVKNTACSRRFFRVNARDDGEIAPATNQTPGSDGIQAVIGRELHGNRQDVLVVSAITRSLTGTKNKEPIRKAVTSAADLGLGGKTVETDSIVGSVLERRNGEIKLLEHSLA